MTILTVDLKHDGVTGLWSLGLVVSRASVLARISPLYVAECEDATCVAPSVTKRDSAHFVQGVRDR